MGFEKPKTYKDQKREALNYPIYSKEELRNLDEELEKYMVEKEITLAGTTRMVRYITVEGFEKYFFDCGVTTEDFSIKNIREFKLLQDKLEQYHDWIRRKEFAIKINEKSYEEMSRELTDQFKGGSEEF